MAQFPDDQCGVVVSKESLCVFCFSVALVYDYACVCYQCTMERELQGDKLEKTVAVKPHSDRSLCLSHQSTPCNLVVCCFPE